MLMINQLVSFGGAGAPLVLTPSTWNPADKGSDVVLSGGDLVITFSGASNTVVRATDGVLTGKWYWEITIDGSAGGSNAFPGIATASKLLTTNELGNTAEGWSYLAASGNKYHSGSSTAYGNTYTTADVIGIALDMDAGKVWWSKNNVWQNSGDPAAGTNEGFSGLTGTIYPAYAANVTAWASTANFGASAFAGTVPTGFTEGIGVLS